MSLRAFLERTYGQGAFLRVLDQLPPAEAEPFREIILPLSWYPVHSFMKLVHASHDLWHEEALGFHRNTRPGGPHCGRSRSPPTAKSLRFIDSND